MNRPIDNKTPFGPAEAGTDPFALFDLWYSAAREADPNNAGVMTLASAIHNRPSARMVLLKEHSPNGFVFYSNYSSRKAHEFNANPQAAIVFWWPSLEKQVRIEGRIEKTSAVESDAYFETRPHDSRLSAWVSAQSTEIDEPVTLEAAHRTFADAPIPRPCNWGGYRLIPELFEFWQGRSSRLHDRIVFEQKETAWTVKRLAP